MSEGDEDPKHLWDLLQQDSRSPNASSSLAYLDKLQGTHLEHVLKEPSLISSEATRVETDLTNLCYREYPLFISVHQCSTAVRNAFDVFDHSLTRLLDSVPDLEIECKSFATSTQRLQSGRHRAGLLLEYQDKINELLQMPKLLETCVRNGYYQDAIEIFEHAQQLDQTSRLVQDVLIEITAIRQLMMVQLVTLLRESIKLPTLIKTVSFIRRLGMSEAELRVVYLTSRLHNFNAHVGELDKSDPIRYIRRYIDLFREYIYDILTQFTAIFDHDLLLVSFANDSVTNLVNLVLDHVPQVGDSAALSSLLVQLGYCAISFSRLGLDFSSHFVEPFSAYILQAYRQGVAKATEVLKTGLEQSLQSSASLSQHLVTPEFDLSEDIELSDRSVSPHVSQLPPLATFINAHLSALNVLRLLAPRHLARRLQALQADQLNEATESIFDYLDHAVANPVVSRERSTHRRSNSSPKAQLLRRNTETLLSPAERTAKRRRSLRIYALFGRSWVTSMRYLQKAMAKEIFGLEKVPFMPNFDEALQRTQAWTEDPVNVNGLDKPVARDLSESFVQSPVAATPPEDRNVTISPTMGKERDTLLQHADLTPEPSHSLDPAEGQDSDDVATDSETEPQPNGHNMDAPASAQLVDSVTPPPVFPLADEPPPPGSPSGPTEPADHPVTCPAPSPVAVNVHTPVIPATNSQPIKNGSSHPEAPLDHVEPHVDRRAEDAQLHGADALHQEAEAENRETDETGPEEAEPDVTPKDDDATPDEVAEADTPENGGVPGSLPNETAPSNATSKKKKKRNKKR